MELINLGKNNTVFHITISFMDDRDTQEYMVMLNDETDIETDLFDETVMFLLKEAGIFNIPVKEIYTVDMREITPFSPYSLHVEYFERQLTWYYEIYNKYYEGR
jgi:hypothetical protein